MEIDLTKLNSVLEINIDKEIKIPLEWLNNTDIRKLSNLRFKGKITNPLDQNYLLIGIVTGQMILLDNLSLEEISYPISIEIEENFEISDNILDILPILWQNILVEVPLKVSGGNYQNVTFKGDGWRLISEDELLEEQDESPFKDLSKLLEERKE